MKHILPIWVFIQLIVIGISFHGTIGVCARQETEPTKEEFLKSYEENGWITYFLPLLAFTNEDYCKDLRQLK